jgi:hypothetical protein
MVLKAGTTVTDWIATNDYSDGVDGAVAPKCIGVAVGAFTDPADATDALAIYILILVEGYITGLLTDGNVVAGNLLIIDVAQDGRVIGWAPTTGAPTLTQLEQGRISRVGWATAADVSTAGTGWINCR